MYYQITQTAEANTVQLQSIGHVVGTPAGELKVGDYMMYNFGSISVVTEIVKETPKSIWVREKSIKSHYEGVRQMLKSRIVARAYEVKPNN